MGTLYFLMNFDMNIKLFQKIQSGFFFFLSHVKQHQECEILMGKVTKYI